MEDTGKFLKDSRDQVLTDMAGVVPGLGLLVASTRHWIQTKQIDSLQRFVEAADLDENYVTSLAGDADKQEMFFEYTTIASKTPNPLACVCLALIYKDNKVTAEEKLIAAHSLSRISPNAVTFLLDPIVKNTLGDSAGIKAINLEKFFSSELVTIATATELKNRNICSSSSIIGDIGMHVRVTQYTLFLHEFMLKSQKYVSAEHNQSTPS